MDCPATVTLDVRSEAKFGLYCINWMVYQAKVYFSVYVNKHGSDNWKEVEEALHLLGQSEIFSWHMSIVTVMMSILRDSVTSRNYAVLLFVDQEFESMSFRCE
jgi:hypothetical protein